MLLTNEQAIDQWEFLISTVAPACVAIDPHCVIAGGAVRDWFQDKPCNDFDIYFNQGVDHKPLILKRLEWVFGLDEGGVREILPEQREEGYTGDNGIVSVFEATVNGHRLQFIFTTGIWSCMSKFYSSSSKGYFQLRTFLTDPDYRNNTEGEWQRKFYTMPPEFQKFIRDKVIYHKKPPMNDYVKRMMEYYPDHEHRFEVKETPTEVSSWVSAATVSQAVPGVSTVRAHHITW